MGQEGIDFSVSKEGRALMLDKGSWAFMPDDLFLDSKTPGNCLKGKFTEPMDRVFCEDDAILDNNDDRDNSGPYDFPVGISPTNSDLNIFGNDQENEERSYLSYDGWSDLSYIEGIDGLFRNCDSSSRQETVTIDNEMSWFSSSSHVTDGLGGASESSLKSFCTESTAFISQHHEPSVYHVSRSGNPLCDEKNVLSYYSTVAPSSYVNSVGVNTGSILKPYSEEQAFQVNGVVEDEVFPVTETNNGSSNMHGQLRRKHIKNQRPTEAKREDQSLEYSNGSSFVISGTSQQFPNPTERSSELSPNVKPLTSGKNRDNYWKHCGQAVSNNRSQSEGTVSHATSTDQVPILDHPHQIENGVDGHCEVGKVCRELPDVDAESSAALEGSGLSSVGSGKLSIEENSFQQLQHVLEQLDLRTKLRIRDGLYRLARSADQRNIGHLEGYSGGEREEHGSMIPSESNECSGFMNVETDTNLIDRSIAHLLFHKPIGEEAVETHGSLSFAYDHCHNSNFTFH